VAIYLGCNLATTGYALLSPYQLEARFGADWNPTLRSMLGRLEYQWSELNQKFPGSGLGGLTLGVLGLGIVVGRHRRHPRLPGARRGWGLWLLAAAAAIFFVVCTASVGLNNVWWGPRWLLPVVPVLAILIATLLDLIFRHARGLGRPDYPHRGAQAAAQIGLCLALGAVAVGLTARYPGQFYQNCLIPPHRVSAAVAQRLAQLGCQDAVVAMPVDGPSMPPIDVRAGLAFTTVPFDANPVIYVRKIEGWQRMAAEMFPTRRLFTVSADPKSPGGFRIDASSSNQPHP
jgi:hypothetical protein